MATGICAPLLVAFAVMAAVAAWLWFRPMPGSAGEPDHAGQAGRPAAMDSGGLRAAVSAWEADADGSSASPSASRWEQKWKLSVTAPVVQSPAQQGALSGSQPR